MRVCHGVCICVHMCGVCVCHSMYVTVYHSVCVWPRESLCLENSKEERCWEHESYSVPYQDIVR